MSANFDYAPLVGEEYAPITEFGDPQLLQVLEAIPAAIYTTDAEGRLTFYNRAAAELAGRRPELFKDKWCVTWRLYQTDGTPLPHDSCPMATALKENRAVRGAEAMAERPDGSRFPFIPFPTPLRDEQGNLVGAVNMLVDISDRKTAEEELRLSEERLRRLAETLEQRVLARTRELAEANEQLRTEAAERARAEEALRQSQKMEAIGQLASGMAHDFNNLLAAILGNLELADRRTEDPRTRELIRAACRAVVRGAKLNEQMLAFSRRQNLALRPVDVNALLGDTAEMLRRTLGGTTTVATNFAANMWSAMFDPTQLELVVLNLALNSRDAMPNGGSIVIQTGIVPEYQLDPRLNLEPGDYVRVAVMDRGIGMTKEVIARACEPFFTTKEPGKGSGLGLSQAYGVVRQSGGDLIIDSTPGEGTTVSILLPRSRTLPRMRDMTPASPSASGKEAAAILVVDDQNDVREVTVAHLQAVGYEVLEARDGASALAILADHRSIGLLIADYAMPGMSGVELVEAARASQPDLPAVITTGYMDLRQISVERENAMLLMKPYRSAELAAAVERMQRRASQDGSSDKVVSLQTRSARR